MIHSNWCFSTSASIYKLEFLLSLWQAFRHQYDGNFLKRIRKPSILFCILEKFKPQKNNLLCKA